MNKGTPADPLRVALGTEPLTYGVVRNLEDARNRADEARREGLLGAYPAACVVLDMAFSRLSAALATKPAETAIDPDEAHYKTLLDNDAAILGHPTESADKSPDAADHERATELMARYRWAVQAGEVNEEYRQARDALYAALTETQRSSHTPPIGSSNPGTEAEEAEGSLVSTVRRPAGAERANEIIHSLVDKGHTQASGVGWNQRVKAAREYLADTQRSSDTAGSDEAKDRGAPPAGEKE